MKIYTIIGGVNGVGKSSLTGALKRERTDLGKIIDVDKITASFDGNRVKGGKKAISIINECLNKNICFTQETTLSEIRTEKTIIRAHDKGYYIRLYYVGLNSALESNKRIKNRVEKGGHNIDSKDVNKRFLSRFEDLTRILPYCDEAIFFDNENGFVEVAEYRNGELLLKGSYHPDWIIELKDLLIEC